MLRYFLRNESKPVASCACQHTHPLTSTPTHRSSERELDNMSFLFWGANEGIANSVTVTKTGTITQTASAVSACTLRHHRPNRQRSFCLHAPSPSPKPPVQFMHACPPYVTTTMRRIILEVLLSSLIWIIKLKSTVHVAPSCSSVTGRLSDV